VIVLFIPGSRTREASEARARGTADTVEHAPVAVEQTPASASSALRDTFRLLGTRKFGAITACALLLAALTVSDGFVYLVLQQRTGTNSGFLPLFYVGTACFYMVFSVPVGVLADRFGHRQVLIGGYALLAIVYAALLVVPNVGWVAVIACLAVMGIYYAGTEGILMALSSATLPAPLRTSGLALVGTAIGIGKMISSVVFGWVWVGASQTRAIVFFLVGLIVVVIIASIWLRRAFQEQSVVHAS
jgi:MFS family permease